MRAESFRGEQETLHKAAYVPGHKNRFAEGEWSEQTLADGSVTWRHTSGAMAGVARLSNGRYVAAPRA